MGSEKTSTQGSSPRPPTYTSKVIYQLSISGDTWASGVVIAIPMHLQLMEFSIHFYISIEKISSYKLF